MTTPSLKALLISDGRPGHFHLSDGVLAAIARRRPVDVTRLEVRRPRWLTPGVLWRLSHSGLSAPLILGYAYGVAAESLGPADIVVSAGGNTLAANVAASQLLNCANVFCGSLRRFRPDLFSLVLTSYSRNAAQPRHVMTLKPSRLDPDTLPTPRTDVSRPPAVAGLLVGGDAGTVRFTDAEWLQLMGFLEATNKALGTRWIVSNSPRTPGFVSDLLERSATAPGSGIIQYIDVRRTGIGTLGELLARAETLVCTADSSSMLSEAVWARRPVVAVCPADMTLPADECDYRRYLESNGWARTIPIAELNPNRYFDRVSQMTPLLVNPLDQLADMLGRRLPELAIA
ncbi:MAG: ELM1/GtrOC1 family putative glycosyltransferase [Hyphomicrobium sp.]